MSNFTVHVAITKFKKGSFQAMFIFLETEVSLHVSNS